MKLFAAILLALLGLSNALPQYEVTKSSRNTRFVGDLIAGILEDVSQQLRENGFDPWIEPGTKLSAGLPVPVLLHVDAHVENIAVVGVSNIIINRINFGLLTQRLDLDVTLPRITISVGDAGLDATILGSHIEVSANNVNLVVLEPRVAGTIQFSVGIISGLNIQAIDLDFTLGGLQFDGQVRAFGIDFSNDIRQLVNVLIPQRLNELENEINELVEIIAVELVGQII